MVVISDLGIKTAIHSKIAGNNWQLIASPLMAGGFLSLHYDSDKTLILAGQNGIWHFDDFRTWKQIATSPTTRKLQQYLPEKTVVYGVSDKRVFIWENGNWLPITNPGNYKIESATLDGDTLWGLDNSGNLHRIEATGEWTQTPVAAVKLWSSTKNIGFVVRGDNFWLGLRDRARDLFRADQKAIAREAVWQINTHQTPFQQIDITENLGMLNQTGKPFGVVGDIEISEDGFLYVATEEGIWKRSMLRSGWQQILMGSNSRIFGLADGSMLAYNSRTNKVLLWREENWYQFPQISHAINSACLIDGVLYVASGNQLSNIDISAAKSINPPNPQFATYLNIGKTNVACDHNQQLFLANRNQLLKFNPQSLELTTLAELTAEPVDICGVGDYVLISVQTPIPKTKNFQAKLLRYHLQENQITEILPTFTVSNNTRIAAEANYLVYLTNKIVRIFDVNGNPITQITIDADFLTDVTIKNNRVYVVGFRNQRNTNPQGKTYPVQSPFLNCYQINQNTLTQVWTTWGFPGKDLGNDMADGRLYQVFASDREVCVLGESAGGNSAFRWNGKDLSTSTLVGFDAYNNAFNSKSPHFLYYGIVDAATGIVKRGQFSIPRTSSMASNTNRARTIYAGSDGYYIGSASTARIENRDLIKFLGKTPIPYAGNDAALLKVTPDLQNREFWFTPGAGDVLFFNQNLTVITVPPANPKLVNPEMPITDNGKSRQNGDDTYLIVW